MSSDPSTDVGLWGVPLAVFAGAIKVGTPFLFVSLGECVTEKSGRVNLGLEGTLLMGAMSGFGVSYLAAEKWGCPPGLAPWIGVLAAGAVGSLMGALHAVICNFPRVNSVAVGIGLMILGYGLAAYLGTPLNKVPVTKLPDIDFGFWSSSEPLRRALNINALFLVGLALVPLLAWMMRNTRWGLILRLAGESEDAAAAMGYSVGADSPHGDHDRRHPGRHRRQLPVAFLPGHLEGEHFVRPGTGGGRPGHLRPLGPGALPGSGPAVRRRQLDRPGAAGAEPGLEGDLVPLEHGALCADAGHHDSDLVAGPGDVRSAAGVESGTLRASRERERPEFCG